MTYDDVKKADAQAAERRLPWESGPGTFIAKLHPAGHEDPLELTALGMMDAIRIARWHFRAYKATNLRLRIDRATNDETFIGSL